MKFTESESLGLLLASRRNLQHLAERQLIADFVEHLEERYREHQLREPSSKLTFSQWLDSQGDYGRIVAGRSSTSNMMESARSVVRSVMDLTPFALELSAKLNERYEKGGSGLLTITALPPGPERADGRFLLAFKYEDTTGWGD